MHENPTHVRPEMKIFGENIAFVFVPPADKPANRVHDDILRAFVMVFVNLGIMVAVLSAYFFVEPLRIQIPGVSFIFMALCGFFLLLACTAAARAAILFMRRHSRIHSALDVVMSELCAEELRLVRRFASGREEVWPRDDIHDVIVERRAETIYLGDEESERRPFFVLCVWLKTGQRVHLFGKAAEGSLDEQDLEWMANELRHSLRLPNGDSPPPIVGARLEKLPDGIAVHLPCEKPETQWRSMIYGFLAMGGTVGGFLFFSAGLVYVTDINQKGPAGIRWDAIAVVSSVGGVISGLCLIGVLVHVLWRRSIVHGIADEMVESLGVRAGRMFRRYLSGREQFWEAGKIAHVSLDVLAGVEKIIVHFKSGAAMHFHGQYNVRYEEPLVREGLVWLTEQLDAALRMNNPATPTVERPSEAIIDLSKPVTDSDKIQPRRG